MDDRTHIEIAVESVQGANGHLNAPQLYRLVSERIRSCALNPSEAKVISEWFDRLAQGDDPRDVFVTKSKGGRPRKGSDGGLDDYDIAWIVHFAIERDGGRPTDVYKAVAKAHPPMKWRTVSNIYSRLKPEIAELAKDQIWHAQHSRDRTKT